MEGRYMPLKQPKIVAIGGGTGLSTFLKGLKAFPVEINAIVTVADDGGSSGILREDMNIPPPGDIRNVLVALSNSPEPLQELLQFRFSQQVADGHYLKGHPVGNLMLAAMTQIHGGDFNLAVKKMSEMLGVHGAVYPVSYKAAELFGVCQDGTIVKGESNFSKTVSPIVEVFYEHEIEASPGVIDVIKAADVIVLGPGSLYTSILPNLIIPAVSKAIAANKKADVVYICNIMTEAGETDGYTVADHVGALQRHGMDNITKVIVNDAKIPSKILKSYEMECSGIVNYVHDETVPYEVVFSRVVQIEKGNVRHNPIKTAASVYAIASEHI